MEANLGTPRELTQHRVNPANDSITIKVMDPPGDGGACHVYYITWENPRGQEDPNAVTLAFQNGPINEVGVNGITHEALLAILEDRLKGFQQGKFACEENEVALSCVRQAQAVLQSRTKRRMEQGVEGTHGLDAHKPVHME